MQNDDATGVRISVSLLQAIEDAHFEAVLDELAAEDLTLVFGEYIQVAGTRMKRQALDHTKMDLLMAKLGVPRYAAVGILESLWHLTAREAPRGNIGKLSDERIAIGIDWRGAKNRDVKSEANRLTRALVEAGWLDLDDEYRLVIHDWHEHADDAVKKAIARSGKCFLSDRSQNRSTGLAPKIYIVQAGESEKVKIGFTEGTVESRLKSLQTGCPEILRVLVAFPGTKTEEIRLHKQFSAYSTSGEWFIFSDEISDFVRQRQTTAKCVSLGDKYGILPEPEPVPEPVPEIPQTPNAPNGACVETKPKPSRKKGKRSTEEIRVALNGRLTWFEEFWKVYPCHEGMNPAMDAYERRVHDRELAADIWKGAKRYAGKVAADPTIKVKFAQGWLNDERWRDEAVTIQPAPVPKPVFFDPRTITG